MRGSARVVVVGGGPAGMMAAAAAAESGARTTLLERGPKTGRKLRLTGKGRCNITNTAGVERFVKAFGPNGRFLYGAFSRFFRDDLLALLGRLGVATKVERGGRVFPQSDSALDVAAALERLLVDLSVEVRLNARVKAILVGPDGRVSGVGLYHGTMDAVAAIVATGGLSYPGTGSTGDGYEMASQLGHTLTPTRSALAPILVAESWVRGLSGLALKNVEASLLVGDPPACVARQFGEMLFTHQGLSGPIALTLSRDVGCALCGPSARSAVRIHVDLKPALTTEELHARLIRDFAHAGNLGPYVRRLVPAALADAMLDAAGLEPARPLCRVTSLERGRLVETLKALPFHVQGLAPIEEAIVTAGGVALSETDPRTMGSRLVDGLYFAGEVLDLDAETGGYNLQAAFSTGWVAGKAAAEHAIRHAGTPGTA